MQADTLAALNEDDEVPLRLSAGGRLDKAAAGLLGVAFAYPGMERPLFTDVDMRVDGESRIVLLGELLRESDFGFWVGQKTVSASQKYAGVRLPLALQNTELHAPPFVFMGGRDAFRGRNDDSDLPLLTLRGWPWPPRRERQRQDDAREAHHGRADAHQGRRGARLGRAH